MKWTFFAIALVMCAGVSTLMAEDYGSVFTLDDSGELNWYRTVPYSSSELLNASAVGITSGDFDKDGQLDVIISRSSGATCIWYELNAVKTDFDYVMDGFAANTISNGMAIGDMDSDGYNDLLLVRNDGYILWYESTERDGITYRTINNVGAKALAIGDYDGDSYTDMLVLKSTTISWYEGNGSDNSYSWVRNFGISNGKSVVIGDVDGDSYMDAVVVDSSNNVRWYESNGNNALPNYRTSFSSNATSVTVVDVDQDGKTEVLVTRQNDDVQWFQSSANNSISTMTGKLFANNGTDITGCYGGEFTDVFVVDANSTATNYIGLIDDNNVEYLKELLIFDSVKAVACGDIDGDSLPDICLGRDGTYSAWFEIDGTNLLFAMKDFANNVKANGIAIHDFHADGYGDVFTISTTGSVTWYEGTANNTLTWRANLTSSGVAVGTGSLDGDSKQDLFVVKTNKTTWYEASATNNSMTWLKDITSTAFNGAADVVIGDVDGDSYGDLLLVDSSSNVGWYESSGTDNATPSLISNFYTGGDATAVLIYDIDGDNTNEIIVTIDNDNVKWFESTANNSISSVDGTVFGDDSCDIAVVTSVSGNSPSIDTETYTIHSVASSETSDPNETHVMFPALHVDSTDPNLMWASFNYGYHPTNEFHEIISSQDKGINWAESIPAISIQTIANLSGNPHAIALPFQTETTVDPNVLTARVSYVYDYKSSPVANSDLLISKNSKITLYEPRGNGQDPTYMGDLDSLDTAPLAYVAIDVNNDGENILLVAQNNDYLAWFKSDADNSITTVSGNNIGYDALDIAACDDPNGNAWVFVVDASNDVLWYEADTSSPNTLNYIATLDITIDAVAVAVGDYDGDSYPDLFIGSPNTSENSYWYEYDPSTDDFNRLISIHWNSSYGIEVGGLALGDFDEDGNMGLALVRDNGQIVWYENNGNNTNAYVAMIKSDTKLNGRKIATGYFDDNSYTDLLICDDTDLQWYENSVGTNNTISWLATIANIEGLDAIAIVQFDEDEVVLESFDAEISFDDDVTEFHFWRSVVRLDDGDLLATMNGKFDTDSYLRTVIVESDDDGKTWKYKSTVATRQSWMGTDGPGEPVMAKLSNGNLLCVMRTGQLPYNSGMFDREGECPMIYSISNNDGTSWSSPVSLGTPGVGPDLVVLDNNDVLLSYGRNGLHLRFADSTGTSWKTPIDIWEGSGCGYSGLRQTPDGTTYLIYGESDFSAWWELPDNKNYLRMVELEILE